MNSFTYRNEQFNQLCTTNHCKLVRANGSQLAKKDAVAPVIDWAARSKELLAAFDDDSKPAYSGKFGTFLY